MIYKGYKATYKGYKRGFVGGAGKNEKKERKENIIVLLFGFMGYGMG